jgi:acetyl-CoA carboxylase carboxyltransferase component
MQALSAFVSAIDRDGDLFKKNVVANGQVMDQLQKNFKKAAYQGNQKALDKARERGELLTGERIGLLLDEDSPFLELFPLGGFGNKATPRTGVCGIGLIQGCIVMILADLPTIRGGAKNEGSVAAGNRALEISIECKLPVVQLIQTAGGDLTQQDKVFHQGGNTFRQLAVRASMKLPTISVVFGSSTAGGAYQPGMSDYIIMIKGHAKVYLGGPPLVKMATGEIVGHEELGGALMHSTVSGVSDYLAENEQHGLQMAQELIATTCRPCTGPIDEFEEPKYPITDLLGIVSPNVKDPFDMSELISCIVDGSRIHFFKSEYGRTLICCWANIAGHKIGIIGNNGVLFADSAQKGAQFIHRCNAMNVPILFLHNITGFMVGKASEQTGLIKYGALMVDAVSNSTVPHISIIVGASFGAGNYAMCGRAYKPRFLFSYPGAKCSVMGADQLSGVMDQLFKDRTAGMADLLSPQEKKELEAEADLRRAKSKALVERQMDAYYTSAMLLDDAIIDPRDTRHVLTIALSVIALQPVVGSNTIGVSRF